MFYTLFFLFVFIPLFELGLLIKIGQLIGAMNTIALVVLTGALGAWLARMQGLKVVRRINAELAVGRMPSDSMFDAVLILVGGILLLTPGVVTDLLGFFLLTSFGRAVVKNAIKRKIEEAFQQGKTVQITYFKNDSF